MAAQDVLTRWEKVSTDPALATKLETRVKPGAGWDAVVEFANANGFKFTTKDYADAVKALPKQAGAEGFQAWKKGEKLELGDKELEQVSGGLAFSSFSLQKYTAFSYQSPLRAILQPWGGGFSIDKIGSVA